MARQVEHQGVVPALTGRQHLPHRERLQPGRPVGRPGEHGDPACLGAAPRAGTGRSADRSCGAARPTGCRRAAPSRARGRCRRRAGSASTSRVWPCTPRVSASALAKTVAPAPPEPPSTPIAIPRVAPPSPASVRTSTSQLSEIGSSATFSAPTSRAARKSPSGTAPRATTCTCPRRVGVARASAAAWSAPTRTRAAADQPRSAAATSCATSRTTPAAAESRSRSSRSASSSVTSSGAANGDSRGVGPVMGTTVPRAGPDPKRRRTACGPGPPGVPLWTGNGRHPCRAGPHRPHLESPRPRSRDAAAGRLRRLRGGSLAVPGAVRRAPRQPAPAGRAGERRSPGALRRGLVADPARGRPGRPRSPRSCSGRGPSTAAAGPDRSTTCPPTS